MKTFKNREQAVKARALALGMKGAAGGWIYQPKPEHLVISTGHSADGGYKPLEWDGHAVCQGWRSLSESFGGKVALNDDGRWYVTDARALYEKARELSGKAYSKYLDALAEGSDEAELLKARHEGLKIRVFAAYDLIKETS